MKKFGIITCGLALLIVIASCNGGKRDPGRTYMPDMAYSRAVETYTSQEDLKQKGINYNAMPVAGTVARGDMLFQYPYGNDSAGYASSGSVKNPVPKPDSLSLIEASRLYLVNCGICHGEKLDGNGPLWKGGDGPYPAAPKNLMGDDMKALSDGTIYHVIVYGKGAMGSYASQLNTMERWMVIHYIRSRQGVGGKDTAMRTSTAVADTSGTAPR